MVLKYQNSKAWELDFVSFSKNNNNLIIYAVVAAELKRKRWNPMKIEFFDKIFGICANKCIERNAKNARV